MNPNHTEMIDAIARAQSAMLPTSLIAISRRLRWPYGMTEHINRQLRDEGILEFIGDAKSGAWHLTDKGWAAASIARPIWMEEAA